MPKADKLDITPSWQGLLPYFFLVLEQGDAEGRKIAREELARMGHDVVPTEETLGSAPFGRISAIAVDGDRLRGGVGRLRISVAEGH